MNLRFGIALVVSGLMNAHAAAPAPLPVQLSDTGLYAPEVRPFAPQYPLWTDGAAKRRWIRLPTGTAIEGTNPDAWVFPPGTRLWKEFGFDQPVETRMSERLPDGTWRFATYVWNAAGTSAEIAPADGVRALPVAAAPNGRYAVPSRADCVVCHEGGPVPVLGFSAVQLAPDLRALVDSGVVKDLPPAVLETRIAAPTSLARAALGYLHGNCGHCHNETGAIAGIDLMLAQRAADPAASAQGTLQSLFGRASRFRAPASSAVHRDSVVTQRMQSNNPYQRMPPLGVAVVDREGIALIEQWIHQTTQETSP